MNADLHECVGAAFLVALCVASAACYRRDHSRKDYADGSRQMMPSPREFAWVYGYIRYSTLVVGLGAMLSEQGIWFVLYRSTVSIYVGAAIAILGFAMFVAARRALGRHYSPCYESYVPTAIVRSGPYSSIRHPIYTANQMVLLGVFVLTGSLWIAGNWALLCFYYARSAVAEERRLLMEHEDYAGYRERTGRFLPRWRVRVRAGASRRAS